MVSPWPPGFDRIPNEEWTHADLETLALKYDTVENHGWYANLDPTVRDLGAYLRDDHILLDYSGGTGILIARLLAAQPQRAFGIIDVDSSPKFLRLALEKFRAEPRVAFRLLRYLKEEKRLQLVQDVLAGPLLSRRVDALASTNAIHLYYGLDETLRSWHGVLRPHARAFVQSGNIRNPRAPKGAWIIDDTVHAAEAAVRDIVREEARFAAYRPALLDAKRMAAHDTLRRKVFLPVKPLEDYVGSFQRAGFRVVEERAEVIPARVADWLQFLAVYHDGILGWVGGSEKVEGITPSAAAIADRQTLLRLGMARVFHGKESFDAVWTYLTAEAV